MRWIAIVMLPAVLAMSGCKKEQSCDSADSDAVCKQFQQCLASGVSAEVCRMGEKDASQSRKDLAPAYGGTADALKH